MNGPEIIEKIRCEFRKVFTTTSMTAVNGNDIVTMVVVGNRVDVYRIGGVNAPGIAKYRYHVLEYHVGSTQIGVTDSVDMKEQKIIDFIEELITSEDRSPEYYLTHGE